MLTDDELGKLMGDLESDRVERTVATKDTDKFAEAICAFSNDLPNHGKPGYLFIGVHDSGTPAHLTITDELLRNLSGLRSDGNILPMPTITVQKHSLSNSQGDIAVVEVLPSDLPPVRYKGRVWVRIGPRRAVANETEERLLSERRTSFAASFDARPCRGSSLDDLSLELFALTYLSNAVSPDVLAENHRSTREQMSSLRFYDLTNDCPTYAGILLFGKDPLRWLPGAYVQFVRYRGRLITDDVEAEHVFSGDLVTMLRDLDQYVALQNNLRPEPETLLRESYSLTYPARALRELLINAIAHRFYEGSTAPIRFSWFADHIEIQSPGGLYGEATPENFPRQTSYRNPVLAEALKVLGYVNKFGRGVLVAQETLARNGNPPADFEFQHNYVLVIVRRPA